MGKFYGNAPFLGHFWTGEKLFWRDFGKFIETYFFILLNHGVSGRVSIQMPFFEAFNCSIWCYFFFFTKNAPYLTIIDNVESKK